MLTRTDTPSNVNRFLESVCGHEQWCFVGTAPHATIILKEIFEKGALFGKRTAVHLSNSCGNTNNRVSNPPFKKLL